MGVALDVFRVLSSIALTIMMLSPIPQIRAVLKNKSTGVGSIVPLVSLCANCNTVMMYGYLTRQYYPVFSTFLTGEVLSFFYCAIFYYYSHEKPKAHKVFLIFGIPVILTSIYGIVGGFGLLGQSRHDVGNVIGYITILSSGLVYMSHFERIRSVFQHRLAVFLQIHMICAGTMNNFMWIGYSLKDEWIIFGPNAFCFAMGCTQIALYFVIHPSKHPLQLPEKEKENQDLELAATSSTTNKTGEVAESPCYVSVASPLTPPVSEMQASQK